MRINPDLAQSIVSKAKTILDRDIFVADTSGRVLAGIDYLGVVIPEALKACQQGRQISAQLGQNQVSWYPFVYENQTTGVFGMVISDSILAPEAISLLQGLAEVIVHQHFLLENVKSTATIKSTFLHEVLTASNVNQEEVMRQADILQINLRPPQAVILFHLEGFEHKHGNFDLPLDQNLANQGLNNAVEKVSQEVKKVFRNFPDNVISYYGNDTFIFLKGIGGENLNTFNTMRFMRDKGDFLLNLLLKLHRKSVTLGIGQYYPDFGGLRKSYQDAKLALDIGTKVWGYGRNYHIKDVGMFITLANINQERKAELAHQILSPLLRDAQLLKTVQVFLASGLNLTDAAKQLHIHRNTLIYRLDKTKKLIGLDPRHFDDALQIKLGMMFYQG